MAHLPGGFSGTNYLIVKTDALGSLHEAKETNNERAVPITMLTLPLPPLGPDLVITDVRAPATGVAGRAIGVEWTVLNQGDTNATIGWNDAVYLSTNNTYNSGDQLLCEPLHKDLLPVGSNYTTRFTVTLPTQPPGTYYLIFRTDSQRKLPEANESNNQKVLRFRLLAPDLKVSRFTAPKEGVADREVLVDWTVLNQGTGTASLGWNDAVYFSTDAKYDTQDECLLQPLHNADLAAGSNYTASYRIKLPRKAPGDYYLIARTDIQQSVFEVAEDNNEQALPLKLLVPDLVVSDLKSLAAPVPGQDVVVAWTVLNQGDGAAGLGWSDSLYFSANPTYEPGDLLLGQLAHTAELPPDSNYVATATVRVPDNASGVFYLIAQANSLQQLFEVSDTNNCRAVTWTGPGAAPKLSVRLSDGAIELSWPDAAGDFKLESTGGLDAGAWDVVTNSVATVDQRRACSISPSATQRYYRLRRN